MGGCRRGGGSGNLKLTYLLPWLAWLTGSQGMPPGFGGGDKGEVMRKATREDLCENNLGVGQRGRGDHSTCLLWSWGWGLGRVSEAQPRLFLLFSKVGEECAQCTSVTCVEEI